MDLTVAVSPSSIKLVFLACEVAIYGCRKCHMETVVAATYVVCDSCNDGLYLLANKTWGLEGVPAYFSFCVPDCEMAHHAYVNDWIRNICWCKQ